MAKADRAVASAELLLAANDLDGACNRAYYAMFDAAKVALIADKAPVHAEEIRSHSGLIAAFSLHFVKPGRVPIELGRAFNKAEELRIVADYRGDSVDTERVTWVVQQAGEFVRFVRSAFFSEGD
jgi:uncharacterized protein (UPF0332 family)